MIHPILISRSQPSGASHAFNTADGVLSVAGRRAFIKNANGEEHLEDNKRTKVLAIARSEVKARSSRVVHREAPGQLILSRGIDLQAIIRGGGVERLRWI